MFKKLITTIIFMLLLTVPAHAADIPAIVDITPRDDTQVLLPLDVQTSLEDGINMITKVFEVAPDVLPESLVEQNLVQDGEKFSLQEILREELPGSTETHEAEKTVIVSCESDKHEDIIPLLQKHLDYDEDGFTGRLAPDMDSIVTEVESESSQPYTVRDTRTFLNLPRNDPAYIPKTVNKNGVALAIANIAWSGGSENDPSPMWSATASYAGTATGSKPDSYLVTVLYKGTVEKQIPGNMRYTLIYEAIPVPELPPGFDWTPALIITGIAIILAGLFVLILSLYRRRKAAAGVYGDEYSARQVQIPQETSQRRKQHVFGFMKRWEDAK